MGAFLPRPTPRGDVDPYPEGQWALIQQRAPIQGPFS
jgi:hypothetical protein